MMITTYEHRSPSRHETLLLSHLREALDSIADGIIVVDDTEQIVYVNRKVVDVMQCSADALRGQLLDDVFPELVDTVFAAQFQRTVAEQQPVTFTAYAERFACWVETRMFPSADSVTICLTDITERRRAEEARQRSDAQYRHILETMQEGVWIVDAQGQTVYANRQMATMLRCDLTALHAHAVFDFLHLEDIAAARGKFAECLTAPLLVTLRFRRADGTPLWALVSLTVTRDGEGEMSGVMALFSDITEVHALDQAKDEFLAVLSHELQTPLTSMLGWSEIALSMDTADLYRRAMPIVHRNARRQQRLINELLDMSKLLHGRMEIAPERCYLDALTQHVAMVMSPIADQAGIALRVLPGDSALPVLADTARLTQCIDALVINGIKFTPTGGSVTLHCRRDGDMAVLEVADTGRGFSAASLQEMFLPFRQVDRDEAAGGLGLGLAIIRGIMDLHRGIVSAVSDGPGHGSVFTLKMELLQE